jgi:hypothetical protein
MKIDRRPQHVAGPAIQAQLIRGRIERRWTVSIPSARKPAGMSLNSPSWLDIDAGSSDDVDWKIASTYTWQN